MVEQPDPLSTDNRLSLEVNERECGDIRTDTLAGWQTELLGVAGWLAGVAWSAAEHDDGSAGAERHRDAIIATALSRLRIIRDRYTEPHR